MRVLFVGTGAIGLPTLRALRESPEHELVGVVTQPDKPAGRARELRASPIKMALRGSSVPILQPRKIKDPDAVAQIKKLNPDVIVVIAYGQILPRTVLEVPPIACLNVHASLLPRWRGAAPIQAAIAAGDNATGVTIMYMAEGLDTGDILEQRRVSFDDHETGGSLHDRLAEIAPEALLKSLQLLATGKAPRVPQDHARVSYAPKLEREAGRIDWSEPAETIERKIRAFNPWPGAFTSTREPKPRKLKIFAATVVNRKGLPGKILAAEESALIIAAGDQALALHEVQLEGKQRMNVAEFMRGNRGSMKGNGSSVIG